MSLSLPDTLNNALNLLWKKSRFTSYFYQACEFIKSEEIPTIAMYEHGMHPALYYNPDFIESLKTENIVALLIHEMLHIIFRHDHRTFAILNPYLQNLAQDMVVNSYIKDNISSFFSNSRNHEPFIELPEGLPYVPEYFFRETGIKDPRWEDVYKWLKSSGQTKLSALTEEIDKMFKELIPDTSKKDSGQPLFMHKNNSNGEKSSGFILTDTRDGKPKPTGSHIFSERSVSKRLETYSKKIASFASKDSMASQDRVLNLMVSIMKAPRKRDFSQWIKKIKSAVDATAHSSEIEFTYKKFNRRYFDQGIYSAGKILKDKERVIAVIDVSASVTSTPGELEKAFGAVEALLGRYRVELLCLDETLFIPDNKNGVLTKKSSLEQKFFYKKGDWKKIRSGSGGTTLFSPLFNDYLKKRNETVLVITDGYIHDLQKLNPYKKTLWIISSKGKENFVPPFGKSFLIDTKEAVF